MGVEIPCFQDSIYNQYPDSLVEVVALNEDAASAAGLAQYFAWIGPIPFPPYQKNVAITYPAVYDSARQAFDDYETGLPALPSIYLIDQTGKIILRSDAASGAASFWPELEEIKADIDSLLANPPIN